MRFTQLILIFSGLLLGSPLLAKTRVILVSIDGLAAFHLENPDLELPSIRRLIREGVWARYSETVFPSVTHPSHTTLITGCLPRTHGVLSNWMRNRLTGERFHVTNRPRSESIRVETIFDAAQRKGLTTAAFFWPETFEDPSITFNLPEVFDSHGMGDPVATREELKQEFRSAGIPIDLYFDWYGDIHLRGAGDIILTRAAGYTFQRHNPDLMAIHILATDAIQHEYGPHHYLSHTALTVADYCVGLLIEATQESGSQNETVLIVTGDHGFISVEYNLNLAPLFDELKGRVRLSPQGWTLYIQESESFVPERDRLILEAILRKASTVEGVARVFRSSEYVTLGLPAYEESPFIAGQYMILGTPDTHLVAHPDEGTALKRVPKERPYHGHGYLPTDPSMQVGFVIAGSGIKRGEMISEIRHVDVAPTIARILDLSLPGADGRALDEVFQQSP